MSGQGTVTLDFGAFPGASDASVTVTGQGGIQTSSLVEAFLLPAATTDHSADEHWVETIRVMAGNIVGGTGFTVYGINTNQINENAVDQEALGDAPGFYGAPQLGRGTRIYGKWNIGWVWS